MSTLFHRSYSGLPRETWILAFVTLVNRSGMMVLPFLSIYLTSARNFTIAQAGIISSFFGIGSMIGSYFGGWISDRIGYFRVQLFSLIAGGAFCITLGYYHNFYHICLAMLICSALLDMLRPAMSAAVSHFAGKENVIRSFSLIRMAINLGAGIGPAIAGIVAGYSFVWIFIGDGATSIMAGVVLYIYFRHKIRNDKIEKKPVFSGKSPLKNSLYRWFLLLCVMYAVIFFQLFCTLPLYYEHVYHLSKPQIGLLIAMNGLIVFVIL